MPITILDYVKSVVGDKDSYSADDFYRHGVAMTGGCQYCPATLAAYNAYPSISGYWCCADCIGDTGYATVADFKNATFGTIACPSCGNVWTIAETLIRTSDGTEEAALECGDCGEVWQETWQT